MVYVHVSMLQAHTVSILHVYAAHTVCTCCMAMPQELAVRTCCKYKLHVYSACPLLHVHVSMLQSVSPCCMSMMHVHAAYLCCMSMMYVHSAYLCCLSMLHFRCTSCRMSMLYVHTACPCFMFPAPCPCLHAACPCCMSLLRVYAACQCCISMLMYMPHVHSACLCCLAIPHVCAACPCFMPMSPCCIAHSFELPPLPHCQNPSNHPRTRIAGIQHLVYRVFVSDTYNTVHYSSEKE
jgi:hypothetical protein